MMARLYAYMGMQKDALPLLEEQLASQRRSLGATHPDVARTLTQLASSQSQSGDYPATIRSATQAQESSARMISSPRSNTPQTYRILGHANYRLGNYMDGTLVKLYQTGLDLVVKFHPNDPERMHMLTGLGRAEQVRGNQRSLAPLHLECAKLAEDGVFQARRHRARRTLSIARRSAELGHAQRRSRNVPAQGHRGIRESRRTGPPVCQRRQARGCCSHGRAGARKRAACFKAH